MSRTASECHHLRFLLIVTGRAEERHLPKLFRSIQACGVCSFSVLRRVDQLAPEPGKKVRLRMVGTGQDLPTKDEQSLSLPVRAELRRDPCAFVLLIDDLEHSRRDRVEKLFLRYRDAVDHLLDEEEKRRASVHFLANMLEAYYFAHGEAAQQVLSADPPLADHDGDVETIRHPKNELKKLATGFDEIEHGRQILDRLDLEHVLSRPDTCAFLRACVGWIVRSLRSYPEEDVIDAMEFERRFRLEDGVEHPVTGAQGVA